MRQRIRVTGPGIYGADGELPIGTEFDINGDAPRGWAGKYHVVERGPAEGAVAVTNDEPGPLDQSIPDLTDYLEGVDDPDEVQALIDAETAGKSRAGALAALRDRLAELLA